MWLPLFAITAASLSGTEAYKVGTKSFHSSFHDNDEGSNPCVGKQPARFFKFISVRFDILFVTCIS